jgi:biopolymer transport protein ExbD
MRFKDRQQNTKIPTIDLIPMLTVMMGVLGFFITISTLQMAPPERVEVSVPDDQETQQVSGPESSRPLLIRLQGEDQAEIDGQVFSQEQVLNQTATFIGQNDKAPVVLVAEPRVP